MRERRPECEQSVPEERIAALAHTEIETEKESEALWEHLERCPDCANLYAAHVRIRGLAMRHVARRRRRGRILWFRLRLPAVAVLLLLLSVAAVAGIVTVTRTIFVGSTDWEDVAAWSAIGYDFEALGVSDGRIHDRFTFTVDQENQGLLFVIETTGRRGFHMCAFDSDRSALWSAGRDWPDYAATFGVKGIVPHATRRLNWVVSDGGIEERFLLVAHHGRRSGAFLVDPQTGRREWAVYYDGTLNGSATIMREEAGGKRPVVLGGHRLGGLHAEPILLVVGPEGDVRQQVAFPVVDQGRARNREVTGVLSSWRAKPMRLEVNVAPGVNFTLEWKAGGIDTSTAEAFPVDHLDSLMGKRYGEAWDEMRKQFDRGSGWLEGVAAGVETRDDPIPTRWRDQ